MEFELFNFSSENLNFNDIFSLIILALICYLLWLLFYKPYNSIRDFTEFGFEEAVKTNGNNAAKRQAINELIRRRKVGDLPPPFPNGWFAILESDELPIKSIKEVSALGLNLVAWRGESGECSVSDAYCPHLGAHLGVGGTVEGDCIQCPFHLWQFAPTGKVACVPNSDSVPKFANLKMYTVLERYGFIYLWYHGDNEEPSWYPDDIPEVENNSWKYRGRTEFKVACHVQEIPENGADMVHLDVVHSPLVLAGNYPAKARFKWGFVQHGWVATWAANLEDSERKHEAMLTMSHCFKLFGRIPFGKVEVKAHQLGPGIVLLMFDTAFGKGVLVMNVIPLEPLLQRVVHRFYSAPTFLHPFGKIILWSEEVHLTRDIRIWNRKTFVSQPILTKDDVLIKQFRRWYSQFYPKKLEKSAKELMMSNHNNNVSFEF